MYILFATLLWGTSFVVLKNTLDEVPVFFILGIRFTIAAVIMLLISRKHLSGIDRNTVKLGIITGVMLFLAYVFQTYGLMYTTPGKNAFLTAVYCVLVPFLVWLIEKKRPRISNYVSAGICIAGIGLISLNGDFTMGFGDGLTLICGLFFGLHIVYLSRAVRTCSLTVIMMFQFAVCAILSWISLWATGTMVPVESLSPESWISILYLTFGCTIVSFLFQSLGQKYTPPSQVAILLTFEAVFGTVFSAIFYGETFTLKVIAGFVLMFIAVLISETGLGRKDRQLN